MTKINKKKNLFSKKDLRFLDRVLRQEKESRHYRRALTLKMLHSGFKQGAIAKLGIQCERTIRNILYRYQSQGIDAAIFDRQRQGQPRKFTKRQEEKITAIACSSPPEGQARWTLELIKERTEKEKIVDSISKESVRILLGSREIKPWKHKMWCVPKVDAEFIRCMEDVLEVYERPYDPKEPVVCVDEKPVQLLNSFRPDVFRKFTKQDYEYKRNGVTNAFCGIEPKAGRHFVTIRDRKTMKDFAMFARRIARAYPKATKIHLIMDNLGTHKEKALIETFGETEGKKLWSRFCPHYTPKHASWLNQAEIEIGMFSRGCIGKQRVADSSSLRKRARAWEKRMNFKKVEIDWGFSRRKARSKFKYRPAKIKWSRH
jgi:transposase